MSLAWTEKVVVVSTVGVTMSDMVAPIYICLKAACVIVAGWSGIIYRATWAMLSLDLKVELRNHIPRGRRGNVSEFSR